MWWKMQGVILHDATKLDFPASQRGFCFQEKEKSISTSYFAHNLHLITTLSLDVYREKLFYLIGLDYLLSFYTIIYFKLNNICFKPF